MAKFNGPREPYRPPAPALSAAAPAPGEAPREEPPDAPPPEPWRESSFDLRQGLEVTEHHEAPPDGPTTG